ncbi:MAG: hypothetical protein M3Q47_10590 [Actinomycetota bacterium]|nr:hypothetical protein [Actinomycetota bacterium]
MRSEAARASLVRACWMTLPRCAPPAAASRRTSSEKVRSRVLSRVRTPLTFGCRPSGTASAEAMEKFSTHQPASS